MLGSHPRLAAMMLAAEDDNEAARACDIAALLEARDPLRGVETPADIMPRLEAIADPAAAASLDQHVLGQKDCQMHRYCFDHWQNYLRTNLHANSLDRHPR